MQLDLSWSGGGGTEGPCVEGCGDDTEGSRVGACGDGTEGSRVGVFRGGTEGSPAFGKSVGEARPPGSADPVVQRAVERLRKRKEPVEKEGSPS